MSDAVSELRQWVESQWPKLARNDFLHEEQIDSRAFSTSVPSWTPLRGDAGFRQYFRLACKPSLLAVYSPPESEDNALFITLTQSFRRHGVLTPAIAAADVDKGFLLLEDFGPSLLLDKLQGEQAAMHYEEALETLIQIQKVDGRTLSIPSYDRDRLRTELNVFIDWFVEKLLCYSLSADEKTLLSTWFTQLEDSALEQPRVVVHRDFHSRNLVYRERGGPGVIDFQDAVMGPFTYDAVSLLRDCYQLLPREDVQKWAQHYWEMAYSANITTPQDRHKFPRWFDWMGLQRHIKVLGVFARLSARDNKHGYLSDLPLVLHYVRSISRQYQEGARFADWLEQVIVPLAKQQPWYAEVLPK